MEHNAFPDSFDLLEFAGKLFNKHPISESEPDKPHLTLVVPKEDEDV